MITITGESKLKIKLSSAVTTHQLAIVGTYSEYSSDKDNDFRFSDSFSCQTKGEESVVVLDSNPIYNIVRELQYLSIKNSDTASSIVWLDFLKKSVPIGILSCSLSPGDTLYYEKGNGWMTIDINGAIKQSIISSSINDLTEIVNSFIAGEDLGGQRVVMISGGEAFYFDPTDENNAGRDVGITKGSAVAGSSVEVVSKGVMTGFSGSLIQDGIYYVDVLGQLTTTIPTGPGVDMRAGVAVDSNTLNVNFSEPVILI